MSQPSEPAASGTIFSEIPPEYSQQERTLLLQIAHESILSFVEKRETSLAGLSAHLSEPRGVFTTIYSNQKLRGCVGYPAAVLPLYRAVFETARAAASDDPRFRPVQIDEARSLKISISVLSPLRAISAEEVRVGRDGLVISRGGQRGLLLPQVAIEHGWDRITFLEQTSLKAGLRTDAWKAGAQIEAFTAEVFGD